MSEVNYIKCDICDSQIDYFSFERIKFSFLNSIDICPTCLAKFKQIKIDKDSEIKYLNDILDNHEKFEEIDCESAYYQGIEDALRVLSHNRLKSHSFNLNKYKGEI